MPAPFRKLLDSSKAILRLGRFDVPAAASDRRSRGGTIEQRSTRKGVFMTRRPTPFPTSPGVRRSPLPLLAGLAVIAASLLLAACGWSSSSPGVAHVGTTSSTSASGGSGGGTPESNETSAANQQKMVKFAQCMRTHGEPEFPEPTEGNIEIHSQNGHGPNPESSQFKAAEKACSKYAPSKIAPSPAQQAKMQEQALKMSECMRSHGVPNFPDPKFSSSGGGVRISLKAGGSGGLNPGSPQFQAAMKACQSNLPGGGKGAAVHAVPGGSERTAVAP
jgi:hypothetical protein